jgi:hypothetical protein
MNKLLSRIKVTLRTEEASLLWRILIWNLIYLQSRVHPDNNTCVFVFLLSDRQRHIHKKYKNSVRLFQERKNINNTNQQ